MNTYSYGKAWIARYLALLRNERIYEIYVFFFLVSILLVSYLALDGFLVLDDHLFHIRFVQLAAENGLSAFTGFDAIYFSEIVASREHLIYYNFLFYLVLWPFALLSPAVLGIKLFGTLATAGSLTLVYALLRRIGARHAFLWTVFFLVVLAESGMLVRLLAARPFALAPVLIMLLLYFLYRERRWAAFATAFAYFYWHTATFFLPVLVSVGYCLLDRYYRSKRFDWRIMLWPLAGTIAAVATSHLIFPGVLSYLIDITLPVLLDAAVSGGAGVAEGAEVYGANFFSIFSPLSALIGPLVVFGVREVKILFDRRDLEATDHRLATLRTALFLGSVVLLTASLFSLRFTDYFIYFSLLYVALAVSEFTRTLAISDRSAWRQLKTGVFVVLALFVMDIGPKIHATDAEAARVPYLTAQGPTDWMLAHLEPGTLVFNIDWDAFPLLYYFTGDQIRYATGLEPRFLYDYDPRLYWLWRNIGDLGRSCETSECPVNQESETEEEKIADVILGDFETDVVIVRTNRTELIKLLDCSPRFRREYRDDAHSIFAIYRVLVAQTVRIGK